MDGRLRHFRRKCMVLDIIDDADIVRRRPFGHNIGVANDNIIYRTIKCRIFPDRNVEENLLRDIKLREIIYNWCIDNDIIDIEAVRLAIDRDQKLGHVHNDLIYGVVCQLIRDTKSFKNLKKKDNKTKCKNFSSVTYGWRRCKVVNGKLIIKGIGKIPIIISRPIEVVAKRVVIKHDRTNKWFANMLHYKKDEPEKTKGKKAVGIDLNISNFLTDTDGLVVDRPQNIKKDKKMLRRQLKKLSRKDKHSKNRDRQILVIEKIHERIRNKKEDFLHKLSRYYVDNYDLICLEDLDIDKMAKKSPNKYMANSILYSSWNKFGRYCIYKSKDSGKYVVRVNAIGTTQHCSVCEMVVPKDLSERIHKCHFCGSMMPRDYNSSRNIRIRGLRKVGWGTTEPTSINIDRLNTLAEIKISVLNLGDASDQVFINESRIKS